MRHLVDNLALACVAGFPQGFLRKTQCEGRNVFTSLSLLIRATKSGKLFLVTENPTTETLPTRANLTRSVKTKHFIGLSLGDNKFIQPWFHPRGYHPRAELELHKSDIPSFQAANPWLFTGVICLQDDLWIKGNYLYLVKVASRYHSNVSCK